jgi:hypothetical protein
VNPVRRRSVVAAFASRAGALEAARLIRDKGLGETRVRTSPNQPSLTADRLQADPGPFDDLNAGLLSANNLGPLSSTTYALGEEAPDAPSAPAPGRPRPESGVTLLVLAAEEDVPAIVSALRRAGGSV